MIQKIVYFLFSIFTVVTSSKFFYSTSYKDKNDIYVFQNYCTDQINQCFICIVFE